MAMTMALVDHDLRASLALAHRSTRSCRDAALSIKRQADDDHRSSPSAAADDPGGGLARRRSAGCTPVSAVGCWLHEFQQLLSSAGLLL